MNLSSWLQNHRRSILFFILILSLSGIFSAFKLPVALFPTVEFPRVVVNLDAGDMTADQMALRVTMPVEQALRKIPGVLNVRSTTSRGSADISINFSWGANMAITALQVNAAISEILPSLPNGVTLQTTAMDPTQFPMLAYSLISNRLSLTELRDFASYQLQPLLSAVTGVARVQVVGGSEEEYEITVNPDLLRAYNLTFNDVTNALAANNVISAVGKMEDQYQLFLVIASSQLHDLQDVRNTILRANVGGIVHLGEVARVSKGIVPQTIKVTADGHDAVLVNIYQQPGSNSVALAAEVKAKLEGFSSQIPKGVKIANWYDQSQLVIESASSVRDAILIGIVLAAMVLFVFLRDLKVTLIAMLVVPAVLASTVVVLSILGMSFNIMTLGGMAAAVGLIIDDAIVMVEHIVRRWRDGSGNHQQVMQAAREFLGPLAGSSSATLIIFVPLAFLTGVTGAFFKALSLTMAASLFISFLVTWLAVPLLADHWFGDKEAGVEKNGKLIQWFNDQYPIWMLRFFRKPQLLLCFLIPWLLLGAMAYFKVGSGFMPSMDEGGFILDYLAAPGTSLTETNRLLGQVEAIIKANPNVQTYSRRTGAQLGGGITEANQGDFFIRLKDFPRDAIDEVMDTVRTEVTQQVPGLDIELAQLMEDLIGDLTAVPQPIEIKLFSDDEVLLDKTANHVASALTSVKGVTDINNGINPAGSALEVHVDPLKAALEGMTPASVVQILNSYMMGTVATEIPTNVKVIGLRTALSTDLYHNQEQLSQLQLQAPDGHLFPVSRVASFEIINGQPQITRENLKRMDAVTARITGRDMGSVIADIKKMMAVPGFLPVKVYYELGGLYQQQQIAFHGLMMVLIAAFSLVFLLLLFLYENFRIAVSIMAIPLLSMSAVFVGLWLTGTELNISSMMGMTMIVGIVTEVAIFYFSEYQLMQVRMRKEEALIAAGLNRVRPILMTTLAAILTLLPLAFALGSGSAMQQPLAIAIISGLLVQVPLVLFVMPVLFHLKFKV